MSKIVNFHIPYDLEAWPRNPTDNFKFKNCLFAATNIAANGDKKKYVYSGYGITFNGAGLWSFENDTAINVIIFGNDDSLFPYSDNRKNKFLVLGEGSTFRIN